MHAAWKMISIAAGYYNEVQEKRPHGQTKNNLFTLYDMAMTGAVYYTKLLFRVFFGGFLLPFISLLIVMVNFKLLWWDTFKLGLAPLVMFFFISSVRLFFIGEYLGAEWMQVWNRPLAIEEE